MGWFFCIIGVIVLVVIFIDQLFNFMNSNQRCFMCWGSDHCTGCIFCIHCERCRKCKNCRLCVNCKKCKNCRRMENGKGITDYGQ